MAGRRNHPRTRDETLAESRMRERVERGEKVVGEDAEWLDRLGPAAHAAQGTASPRHSHVRQQGKAGKRWPHQLASRPRGGARPR